MAPDNGPLSEPGRSNGVKSSTIFLTIFVGSLIWAMDVRAEGDAIDGRRIAGQWCAACHATDASARAPDIAPSFTAIAADPAQTPDRLRLWIADPHGRMPNLNLTRIEIENVIAYIRSLKSN